MAREEHDREDLLGEAKALVERVAVRTAADAEEIVFGFRRDASASVYFGADPSYQFTSRAELRRAFVDNVLYKVRQGKLVALRRHRGEQAVALRSRELSEAETRDFFDAMRAHLDRLADALDHGRVILVGQVPEGADVVGRVQRWLAAHRREVAIAPGPRVA